MCPELLYRCRYFTPVLEFFRWAKAGTPATVASSTLPDQGVSLGQNRSAFSFSIRLRPPWSKSWSTPWTKIVNIPFLSADIFRITICYLLGITLWSPGPFWGFSASSGYRRVPPAGLKGRKFGPPHTWRNIGLYWWLSTKSSCFGYSAAQRYAEFVRDLGFAERIRGSHHIFTKEGVEEILNSQPKDGGKAKGYQVKRIRQLIIKYRLGVQGRNG